MTDPGNFLDGIDSVLSADERARGEAAAARETAAAVQLQLYERAKPLLTKVIAELQRRGIAMSTVVTKEGEIRAWRLYDSTAFLSAERHLTADGRLITIGSSGVVYRELTGFGEWADGTLTIAYTDDEGHHSDVRITDWLRAGVLRLVRK